MGPHLLAGVDVACLDFPPAVAARLGQHLERLTQVRQTGHIADSRAFHLHARMQGGDESQPLVRVHRHRPPVLATEEARTGEHLLAHVGTQLVVVDGNALVGIAGDRVDPDEGLGPQEVAIATVERDEPAVAIGVQQRGNRLTLVLAVRQHAMVDAVSQVPCGVYW
ncbi:hypothetical protein [Arhodomonas sp. AD133]|uniref:hypothetical protein n=1 Tax=Arhodomonas sp. AD133 TaxID=3415009 RepID=UPI003EBD5862